MSTRDDIIERWQTRLAQAQSPPAGESPHGRWVRRAYARIYRFLLACYGGQPWNTSPTEVDDGQQNEASSTTQELLTALGGKPAKTAAQIGKVLKSVHAANDGAQSDTRHGVGASALDKNVWIRAAEFKYASLAMKFCRMLSAAEIPSRIDHITGRYFVEVQRIDLDAALAIVTEHREAISHAEYIRQQRRNNRRWLRPFGA